LAFDRQHQKVEFEIDAKEVLILMDMSSGGRSQITCICQAIKELCVFIPSVKLSSVGSHACAKRANGNRRSCLWVN
jgi:hypothetical protein